MNSENKNTSIGASSLAFEEPTVFEQSVSGRKGTCFSSGKFPKVDCAKLYGELYRKNPAPLPELCEADVVRHFTRLSILNYHKDLGLYPLGSCTMKHNPKIANLTSSLEGFADAHPLQDEKDVQANLKVCYELEKMLADISGMHSVALWPAAGSHGELTGMLMIRAYHTSKGNPRTKVLIPDSAHGTNPASAATCHYKVVPVKSGPDGLLDPMAIEAAMDEEVAAIMITNPNTLGIFEKNFKKVADIVHSKGGLVYMDGANLNALMGIARPGEIGADVMHINLHKTFATPHGGGGPGAGPVAVVEKLADFLPLPRIKKTGDVYSVEESSKNSIGRMNTFFGNFAVLVRAYTYIKQLGSEGLKDATRMAVLNANYVKARLKNHYHLPYEAGVLHECVFSDKIQNEFGIKTMDVAKRLMDFGFHPPTVYFPLIVSGAIMIEPTETENKAQLDAFCDAMIAIADECKKDPDVVHAAPQKTFRSRLDEVRAAREPKLKE